MTQKERLELAIQYAIEADYPIYKNYLKVRKRVKTAPKICILGLGDLFAEFSKIVFKELFGEMNIVCVSDFDEKNWGKEFLGFPCVPPHELTQMGEIVVVITAEEYLAAKAKVEEMGLEAYFIGDCYSCYFDHERDVQWMVDAKEDIGKAYNLLGDERSKEIYVELLCQKLAPHLAEKEFYKLCDTDEYFCKDMIQLADDECFVDCGAYVGDTVEKFLQETGGKYEAIFSFEPDKQNYAVALKMFEDRKLERVYHYNCGLSNENSHPLSELLVQKSCHEVVVPKELPTDSMVSVNIKKVAPDVRMGRLDDLLAGRRASFLKIDVEGFEEEMLKGAEKLIGEQKPKIAICVYHLLHHMWTLPLMLHKIRPDYRLYIRHYSAMGYDTVCYAV